jgi:hypothetical protein
LKYNFREPTHLSIRKNYYAENEKNRAEALHFTGVMDDLPDFSDDQIAVFTNVKNKVLRETDKYRIGIRKTLSRESIQTFFDNEKPAAFGLVSGALAATLL